MIHSAAIRHPRGLSRRPRLAFLRGRRKVKLMRTPPMRARLGPLPKLTVAAIACFVVAFSAVPASAEDNVDTTDPTAVAALVAEAAPDGAQPVDASSTGTAFETSTADATTTIPVDPERPIEVTADVAGREISASITLPDGLDLDAAKAAGDGTVVYPGGLGGVFAGAGSYSEQPPTQGLPAPRRCSAPRRDLPHLLLSRARAS